MEYDAVVLDMDGVIVERSPSWVFDEAAETVLSEVGIDNPTDEEFFAVRSLYEMELPEARDHFAEEYDVAFENLWQRRNELVTDNQWTAMQRGEKTLYDDVDAVERLPAPRGIVSNNQHGAVENVLKRFELKNRFQTWYGLRKSTASLDYTKPDTTYMEQVLSELGTQDAIYVGDRGSDVAAAHGAGLDAAFVRREFNEDDDPDPEPRYDVDSLHELADAITGDEPASE